MRSSWLLSVTVLASSACAEPSATSESTQAPVPAIATQTPSAAMRAPEQPDPGALSELVAQAPKQAPSSSAPDGGTLVGTKTGVKEGDGSTTPKDRGAPNANLTAGDIEIQPLLSSPAIERAARAQIYWPLHDKCVGPNGKPPPADAITLAFTILSDGSVDPASVTAGAEDARYEPLAECVLREFSALPFRGPAAVRRSSARVIITWPSVD